MAFKSSGYIELCQRSLSAFQIDYHIHKLYTTYNKLYTTYNKLYTMCCLAHVVQPRSQAPSGEELGNEANVVQESRSCLYQMLLSNTQITRLCAHIQCRSTRVTVPDRTLEYYSVVYFKCTTKFDTLQCRTSTKGEVYTRTHGYI